MSTRRASRKSTGGGSRASASKSSRSSRHDSAMESEAEDMETDSQAPAEEEEEGTVERTPAAKKSRSRASAAAAVPEEDEAAAASLELEDTPTRLSRLDEKSELQGLNKRLEFYILKQRERDASADAWARELANLRNKHATDLEHQKSLYENQLQLVRKNRDDLSSKLSKVEGESAHKDNLLHELQARLASEHKARGNLEGRVESLSRELLSAQSSLHSATTKLDNLQHEFQALKASHDDLEKQLADARKAAEHSQSKANKLSQQYADLKDEYDTLQSRHSTDAKKYDKQIHELCMENNRTVDSIRGECEKRLNALFAERQFQYDKDKTDSLAELKSSYDQKVYGYRTRLEELGHDFEQEKSNRKAAQRALDDEKKIVSSLKEALDAAEARNKHLEKALADEKANPELMKQIHEKNETIKRIKIAFKRKDAEFDELMDVKIMLDMEIKAYRSLLDQEDSRLNTKYESHSSTTATTSSYVNMSIDETSEETHHEEEESREPASKKRRRSSAAPAATPAPASSKKKTRSSSQAPEPTPAKSGNGALLFSRNDVSGSYIGMTNNSANAAQLNGWELRAPHHDARFAFPNVKLESGATFYVSLNESSLPASLGSKDLTALWPKPFEWNSTENDVVKLHAPSGQVVASVDVISPNAMDTDAQAAKNKGQCTIM